MVVDAGVRRLCLVTPLSWTRVVVEKTRGLYDRRLDEGATVSHYPLAGRQATTLWSYRWSGLKESRVGDRRVNWSE